MNGGESGSEKKTTFTVDIIFSMKCQYNFVCLKLNHYFYGFLPNTCISEVSL